jgi:hypothetical protein
MANDPSLVIPAKAGNMDWIIDPTPIANKGAEGGFS